MIIWLGYLIPIITILYLILMYRNEVVWWEYSVILVVPVGIILISSAVSKSAQTRAYEFFGGEVHSATYTEPWNEWISQTCTRCVSTDKNGNCTSTETYDCSYCSEHGPSYNYTSTIGGSMFDGEEVWNTASATWGKKFVYLGRSSDCPFPRNGNEYVTSWKGDSAHLIPYFLRKTYENRVQAAPTLFSFAIVDKAKVPVYDYPKVDGLENTSVLTDKPVPNQGRASDLMNWYNGKYGGLRQVHAYLIVFHSPDQDLGHKQEAYWKGGGKNELVTTVGVDNSNNILWVYVFSWSPDKMPSITIRDSLMSMHTFDAVKAVDVIGQLGVKKFVRKHFRDFAYIQIQPSMTATVVSTILILLFCVGFSFWAVVNEYSNVVQRVTGRGYSRGYGSTRARRV